MNYSKLETKEKNLKTFSIIAKHETRLRLRLTIRRLANELQWLEDWKQKSFEYKNKNIQRSSKWSAESKLWSIEVMKWL